MELVKSIELNCTLGDVIALHGLVPGMLIHLDGTTILIGDGTPFMQPSENDGGIGWERYCQYRVKRIDFYAVPSEYSSLRDCYTKPRELEQESQMIPF